MVLKGELWKSILQRKNINLCWIFSLLVIGFSTLIRLAMTQFYSYAEDMGYGNHVKYDTELKRFFPTKEFEETSKYRDFIDEFENDTFWDELLHRLVERDLIKQEGGVKNVMNIDIRERFEKEEPLEKKYATEFEVNGLDNIRI
jgi:hypothetical protein